MLLSEFCFSAIEHIQNGDYGVKPIVKLYTDGYQSSDPLELQFIHSANIKYHNIESDKLIGTYLDLSWNHDSPVSPMCRMEARYLMRIYKSGGWEKVDRVVQANIDSAQRADTEILNHLDDYDYVREHLILRPISVTQNQLALQDHLYRQIGDIALVLYAKIHDDGQTLMSAKIPRIEAEGWSLSEEEIFSKAMENTALLAPPRLYLSPLELINAPYMRGVFMGGGEKHISQIPFWIAAALTTTRQVNGAVAIFYPGVKERISELYGGSYHVSFTSDSEIMLHSVRALSAQDVWETLKHSNQLFPETMLSNSVYRYDADTGIFAKLDL